jgi:hypothetical protein
MTVATNELRFYSVTHLEDTATVAFGDDGPELTVPVSDIRSTQRAVDWSSAMQRAVEIENVRLAAAGKAPIDGLGVGYDWVPDWQPWTGAAFDAYRFGTWTRRNGVIWQSRIDFNTHEPPSFWRAVDEEVMPWVQPVGAGDHYELDDKVTHGGREWLSRRAVNTWEPGAADSGWLEIGPGGPHPWYFLGNEGYPADWLVTRPGGAVWRNPGPGSTHWEPGVAVWVPGP